MRPCLPVVCSTRSIVPLRAPRYGDGGRNAPRIAAQAGSFYSTNCYHGFGHDHGFGYNRSYNYGTGNGNTTAWGSGSGGGYGIGGCVEIQGELVNPYVIEVPQPRTEKEIADAAARGRLWEARCRPTIRQDHYGVRRYHYAAPGCEYGKYE